MSKVVRLPRSNDKGIGFSGFRDLDMSVQIHKVGVRCIITRVVHLMLVKVDKFSSKKICQRKSKYVSSI